MRVSISSNALASECRRPLEVHRFVVADGVRRDLTRAHVVGVADLEEEVLAEVGEHGTAGSACKRKVIIRQRLLITRTVGHSASSVVDGYLRSMVGCNIRVVC